MKIWLVILVLITVLGGTHLVAQTETRAALPPVLAGLLGEWSGTGIVTGRASTLTMSWSIDLGGAFVHLRFRNEMAATANRGVDVLESRGYYRAASASSGAGTWADSRGVIVPLSLALTPTTLTSDWGSESTTERGRTVYVLTARDTLEVTDFVRMPTGEYREFGRATFSRVALK